MDASSRPRRVAIVAGCRTPFCKSGTSLDAFSGVDLARLATIELVNRSELAGDVVDEMYFGQVVASPLAPNLAREVGLLPQFPKSVPAASVNRACASANAAIVQGHDQIALGNAEVVIAGGAESLSQVPILHSRRFSDTLVGLSRAKTLRRRLGLLAGVRPRDLVPVAPAIAEPSTGETMGQSAEKMAKINGVNREEQDRFALRSHERAAAGIRDGRLAAEIGPVATTEGIIDTDNGVREDSTLDKLASLQPVFDRRHGTVTAGNSSPLTDGAGALLLMSEEAARAHGYKPRVFIRSYAVAALDPGDQLLQGPAYAVPLALDRAGLAWSDIGLIEMHEAFAAQVLSNIRAFESKEFAVRELGRSEPVGRMNWDILNVMGGSISLGHPFGATGARVTTTLANEMKRRGTEFGLISVCAAGGMGFAMVLEQN